MYEFTNLQITKLFQNNSKNLKFKNSKNISIIRIFGNYLSIYIATHLWKEKRSLFSK